MKAFTATTSRPGHGLPGKLTVSALVLGFLAFAGPVRSEHKDSQRRREPDLPSPVCDRVDVPAGNRISSHAYALGVQIYHWSGTSWVFAAPDATLFADPCYDQAIGVHYAGPTWEANDGSKVVATRVDGCTPFRGAIPWLLLETTSTSGHGEFKRVTYIQRVNTIGGTAPREAGAFVGDEARVPYTAEYYFYRASKH